MLNGKNGKIKIQDRIFKNVKIQKIRYLDKINVKKFKYQIIEINGGRVFSNFVENVSIISNNTLLEKFSFQQINGYLSHNKNQVILSGTPKFKKKFLGK